MVTFENKISQAPSALRNSSPVARLGHLWLERAGAESPSLKAGHKEDEDRAHLSLEFKCLLQTGCSLRSVE